MSRLMVRHVLSMVIATASTLLPFAEGTAADPATVAVAEQVVQAVRAKLPKGFAIPQQIDVALTIGEDLKPSRPACAAEVRADLEARLDRLSAATRGRFTLVEPEWAMVNIVVGEHSIGALLHKWWRTAKADNPGPTVEEYSIVIPHGPGEWWRVLYRDGDRSPLYGELSVTWYAVGDRRVTVPACRYNFVRTIQEMLSEGVRREHDKEFDKIAVEAVRVSGVRDTDRPAYIEILMLPRLAIICAGMHPSSTPISEVAECAVKLVDLEQEPPPWLDHSK